MQPIKECAGPDTYVYEEDPEKSIMMGSTLELLATVFGRPEGLLLEDELSGRGSVGEMLDESIGDSKSPEMSWRASPVDAVSSTDEPHSSKLISPASSTEGLNEPHTAEMDTITSPMGGSDEHNIMELDTEILTIDPASLELQQSAKKEKVVMVPPPLPPLPLRRSSRIAGMRKAREQSETNLKRRRDSSQDNVKDKMDIDKR
jgi:hypothetical protein